MGVHPVDGHMVQFQGMTHCKMPTKQGQTPLLSTALTRSKARVSIYKIWGNGIFGRYPIISNLLVTEIVLLNPLTHQPINHILQNDCRRN